jgi:hypothetical protein
MREHLPKMTFRAFPNGGHDIHHEKLEEILSDMLAD